MAKILFTWELGMGLGHIVPIKSLAKHFVTEGHDVYIALKDLKHGYSVFADMPITLLQSPISQSISNKAPIACYSQLLAANGFNKTDELASHCLAWQSLYDLIQPDVIFFDHSPTALMASRGFHATTVHMGTGFTIPPDQIPFAPFQPDRLVKADYQALIEHETSLLNRINNVLSLMKKPTLQRLGQLYGDIDHSLFTSLPEFDHFGARIHGNYVGVTESEDNMKSPVWPNTSGKKVFIYLKPFEYVERILDELIDTNTSVIFYTNDINSKRLEAYQNKNICFEADPLDIKQVAKEANIAITNGNHGTLLQFILNRVPVMMIPLHWEQQLLALRLQSQGIGVLTRKDDVEHIVQSLRRILRVEKCSAAVDNLAAKYETFNGVKLQKDFCFQIMNEAKNKRSVTSG